MKLLDCPALTTKTEIAVSNHSYNSESKQLIILIDYLTSIVSECCLDEDLIAFSLEISFDLGVLIESVLDLFGLGDSSKH